jgi:MoaA/NifB/PqqE/SkfB family radical SAM enzyme
MAFWRNLFKKETVAGAPPATQAVPAAPEAVPPPPPDPKQAHAHAAAGRVYPISQLLAAGMPIDQRDEQGQTMLDVAIAAGQAQAARMLMFRGAALYDKSNWQSEGHRLREQMASSPLPHMVNQQLSALECDQSIAVVSSFPRTLYLGMSNVCNARCVFCDHANPPPGGAVFATPEDVERMTWLKYVTALVWGAGAETLTNRQFPEMLIAASQRYPHLESHLCTNGIGLNDSVIDALAGRLAHINVSLNAANCQEWEKTAQARGFDRIVEMLKALHKLKQARGATKPIVALSMVLHTKNQHTVPDFINLAAEVGAQQVQLADYVGYIEQHADEQSPQAESGFQTLLDSPDVRTPLLEAAQKQADALGLKLWRDESFLGTDSKVSRFRRGGDSRCWDPWARCSLTLDRSSLAAGRGGELGICCYGVPSSMIFQLDRLDEKSFVSGIWNHPILQYYRKTVNRRGGNCVCDSCSTFGQHGRHADQVVRLLRSLFFSAIPAGAFTSVEQVEAAFESINARFQAALREKGIEPHLSAADGNYSKS